MNGVVSARGGRLQTLVMENRKFTNTAIPVFSGAEVGTNTFTLCRP